MGLGVGIFLIAVGAIMVFAIHVNPTNGAIDVHTVGWILMAAGALGIVLSMVFWSSWVVPDSLGVVKSSTQPARRGRRPSSSADCHEAAVSLLADRQGYP